MDKKKLKEIFDLIIEKYDDYEIKIDIFPDIQEVFDFGGNGERFTTYIRTIEIKDKVPIKEWVEKKIWE